jgi:hypothetical protein
LKKNSILLFLILLLSSCEEKQVSSQPDYSKVLDSILINYHRNLDTGRDMHGTARNFQLTTDSIVEVLFQAGMELESIDRDSLMLSQDDFLHRRLHLQRDLWKEIDASGNNLSRDSQMIAFGELGEMNYKRAKELNDLLKREAPEE